jgi:hypothetical protein
MNISGNHSIFHYGLMLFSAFNIVSCGNNNDTKQSISRESENKTIVNSFYGWKSANIENSFVTLNLVPELGGRVMGYSLGGTQLLWHNTQYEGQIDIFLKNKEPFIDAGGSAVLLVPQNLLSDQLDRIPDVAPYDVKTDGATITAISPADTVAGRNGLQYTNTATLRSKSSLVEIKHTITNNSPVDTELALCHLVKVPASRRGTLYVPVSSDKDWKILNSSSEITQWLGVSQGLFRAQYKGIDGKIRLKVSEGWAAWHDEDNNIAFVIQFPVEQRNKYPDDGYNVEILSIGKIQNKAGQIDSSLAHFEIGVFGPLSTLNPGTNSTLPVTWAACRCSGITSITPVGAVVEKAVLHPDNTVTARFGSFSSGTLEEFFYDAQGNQTQRIDLMQVSPNVEIVISHQVYIPYDTVGIQYRLRSSDKTIVGIYTDVKIPADRVPKPPAKVKK